MKKLRLSSITAVCLLLATFTAHSQTALYVDSSRASSGAGTTWATAYKTLSEALARANSTSTVTDVYVAKGTYIPATASGAATTVKDSTFPVKAGLSLFGGYPSGGGATASPGTNPTVLSANNNNYHVLVVNSGTTLTDTISGFIITGAPGTGSGYFSYGSIGNLNVSAANGGGICIQGSTVLSSCVVTGNAAINGGGVYFSASTASYKLTVINSSFTNNSTTGSSSSYGGAIYMNAGAIAILNTLFARNNSTVYAGAVRVAPSTTNTFTNCTFAYNNLPSPNSSGGGSAIRIASGATTTINNCIFWGNTTQTTALAGDVIGNGGTTLTINNSIGQDVPSGNSNVNNSASVVTGIDPQFNSATDYTLFTTSPAINAGSNTLYTGVGGNTSTDVDVAGKTRVYNAATIDMGAYEFQRTVTTWNGTAWSNGTPGTYTGTAPTFDVIIASSTTIPASFACQILVLNSGVSLTSTVSYRVYTYGDIYNNGNGSSGFYQWFIYGSCTLHGNPYRFGGALYLSAANITFNTNNGFVLSSDATSTGEIYTIASGSAIVGTVTQERYIPASNRKNYTLVTSPVSSPTIYTAWQEGGAATTGYGTQITGPAGTSTANGFDATSAAGIASIYAYNDNNATGSKWVGLTNTNATTLAPGKGFLLYVRGDRTVLPGAGSSNTTLRATGIVATSNVDLSASLTAGANKFSLVANPFTISINWNSGITRTNLTGSFTVYDANNAVFITSDGTTRSPSISTHQSAQYLQNGQAFFVQNDASGNTPGLVVTTTAKTVAPANGASAIVFGADAPKEELDVNVYSAADAVFADGTVAVFSENYLAGKDAKDAGKMTNFAETFALLRNNETLSIEGRPMVKATDTLFFSMAAFTKKQYTMVINGNNFAAETATLIDRFTNTTTPVNLKDTTRYMFSVTSDATSAGNDRFMIVLNNAPLAVVTPAIPLSGLFVKMGPNPVKDQLQVNFQTAAVNKTTIHVVNSLGQVVKTIDAGTTSAATLAVDMSGLAAGVYLVQLVSGSEPISVQKIVKE